MNLTNCLFGFVSVNSSTYTIYMGKDKYESKFTKAFDFEIAGRRVLFVAFTVFVINFFHSFWKLYLTDNNWPYFLSPYTHCEVVQLEPIAYLSPQTLIISCRLEKSATSCLLATLA